MNSQFLLAADMALKEINAYSTQGRIIAECGGMMYLGKAITDSTGKTWPMANVLDLATSIATPQLTIGYRRLQPGEHIMKGHEFHFSQPVGEYEETPLFYNAKLLASYAHFYWGEELGWLKTLLV